jgi:hypothetical protein
MPVGPWEAAYYVLPSVGNPDSLGIDELSTTVTLQEKKAEDKWEQVTGQKIETAWFNKVNKGKEAIWTDGDDKPIKSFVYPLKELYKREGFNRDNYRFEIVTTIRPKTGKSLDVKSYSPLFDGERAMGYPTNLVDVVTIDGTCLSYGSAPDLVKQAVGQLKAGTNSWTIKLDADNDFLAFLVPADEKDIKVSSLNFRHSNGKLGSWVECNKNLRELDSSLWFTIFDGDWDANADRSKLPADAIVPLD